MKTALITGITGQDGSYLAELLLDKGYEVHGLIRRSATHNTQNIEHILPDLKLHVGDVTDGVGVGVIVDEVKPMELYNLAAQSHVRLSFECPAYTFNTVANGTLNLLESVRKFSPDTRFYQASSSEMFGMVQESPQTENTPLYPRSPYGCAKCSAHWLTMNYRESYGLHASCGILFNHESPRRGDDFVTRKITLAAARIAHKLQQELILGNVMAQRDWGYAKDYVEAMWLMLQQPKPDDFVIATGATHSVYDFLHAAFSLIGLPVDDYVTHDSYLNRPAEVDLLLGDASKARNKLGWEPKVYFNELVEIMVNHDLKLVASMKS